jgi:hypothetical protein
MFLKAWNNEIVSFLSVHFNRLRLFHSNGHPAPDISEVIPTASEMFYGFWFIDNPRNAIRAG